MTTSRTIAVIGATGAQGGGLIRAILADKSATFSARALTRDPDSAKAKALSELGVEVVQADVDDPRSLERAFAGAYGAFCVSFFWEHMSPEREFASASAMAEAARSVDLSHVVWSTLEDTRRWVPLSDTRMPTLKGNYKVPHMDAKGEADAVFARLGVPTTYLRTSFYWESFIVAFGPRKGPDGKLAINLPMGDAKLPGIASKDIGKCALGIFKQGEEYIGQTIGICGEQLTGKQMAAAFSDTYGIEIGYNDVPLAVFRSSGQPGAEDIASMFQFKRDFEEDYCGARSRELSRQLNPALQSFEEWLDENKDRMTLESGRHGA